MPSGSISTAMVGQRKRVFPDPRAPSVPSAVHVSHEPIPLYGGAAAVVVVR
jgi:hypothetical protein